ncbi:MAG: hypothetical protein LBN95_12490 [Prevotellaceae bacterium]|jgi:predicted transcriptional regulator|nr:hypothetical protein [Prevotellaceae bacterium]
MNKSDFIDRLCEMHKFISNENTGSPTEFAKKFKINRRQLYYILDELKINGAVIKYSRKVRSFYYENDFNIELKIIHISNK